MRGARQVAAIYDVHGNLPALEAVLEEVRAADVDAIVVGGDVIPGPMPAECIEALSAVELPTFFIYGNGERDMLTILEGGEPDGLPAQVHDVLRWSGTALDPETIEQIRSWPRTVTMRIDGLGRVLFCHATPRSDRELFTSVTPEEPLRLVFDSVSADVVVCGHTHMQFDRRVGDVRVANAGSVGMPFGETGAEWLILGPDCHMRRTIYDLDGAAARLRGTTYPQANQFARDVLAVPSAAEMMDLFEKAALG